MNGFGSITTSTSSGGGGAYFAHIGGFISGFIMAFAQAVRRAGHWRAHGWLWSAKSRLDQMIIAKRSTSAAVSVRPSRR